MPARIVMEWMQHGIALVADCLWAADELIRRGGMTVTEKGRLERELKIRQRVLAKFAGGDVELTPGELVWRRYILAHIGLEIRHEAQEIDLGTFLRECQALREKRREEGMQCI